MTLRSVLPAKLLPEQITAIIDSREQLQLDVSPLQTLRGTLATGDYSVQGLENVIALERKSLDDLVACCGRERSRFEKEVQRLLSYETRAIVVEASWSDIANGEWRSKLSAKQVEASLMGWISRGIPVVMSDDHQTAGRHVARILFLAARRRYHEARMLSRGISSREDQTAEKVER